MNATRLKMNHRKLPWAVVIAAATAVATARVQMSDMDRRMTDIEASQPEVTADRSQRNEKNNAAIQSEIDKIKDDGSKTLQKVDWLCGHFGMPER